MPIVRVTRQPKITATAKRAPIKIPKPGTERGRNGTESLLIPARAGPPVDLGRLHTRSPLLGRLGMDSARVEL
jgi:hypothetical protein